MTKDLEEYYENLNLVNDKLALYEDKEGNIIPITPTIAMLVAVQYQTYNKQEYEQAVFNQIIPKDIICKETKRTTIVSKEAITHNPKDKYTLVDKEETVKELWLITNGLGLKKAVNTKEEALSIANKINNKILEVCGIDIRK